MSERLSSLAAQSFDSSSSNESSISRKAELEGLEGSAQAALARLAERQQVSGFWSRGHDLDGDGAQSSRLSFVSLLEP